MPDQVLKEEPLQFGDGGRLFGILTMPGTSHRKAQELPVFVFLNAGLLHRVGPRRLYVRLARELSQMGFISLRVDLAGTGDSPRRPGLTYSQSVAADFKEILGGLESRLGSTALVLAGLCSGAHDAVRLAPEEPRVVGMVLLDPICFQDDGFLARAVILKYADPARYIAWLKRRFETLTAPRGGRKKDNQLARAPGPEDIAGGEELPATWGVPTREQLRAAFEAIRGREGRVLSVFSQMALEYYNEQGQLGRVVGMDGYQQSCTELFWPEADHTYTLELHRRRLIDAIKAWAGGFIRSRTGANN